MVVNMVDLKVLEHELEKHDLRQSVKRVLSAEVIPAVASGENFLSDLLRVKLEVILASGRKAVRSVILKKVDLDCKKSNTSIYTIMFWREVNIYKNICDQMEELFEEFGDYEENNWCEFYGHNKTGLLILQDLKVHGYSTGDSRKGLGMEHSRLALKALARFHAASRVLIARGSLVYTTGAPLFAIDRGACEMFIVNAIRSLCQVIDSDWGPDWKDVSARLNLPTEEIVDRVLGLVSNDTNKKVTLQHGDLRTNNILIKTDDLGYPIGVKLIDYQLSFFGRSLAWDLIYFLYTSVERDLRRREKDKLIRTYHKYLLHYLQLYGYPEGDIPTIDSVFQEVKDLRFWSVVVTVFHFSTFTSPKENTLNINDFIGSNGKSGFHIDTYRRPGYFEDVAPDLRQFVNELII